MDETVNQYEITPGQLALDSGYQNHPERFVKGRPPPKTVAINPITLGNDGEYADDQVNFPTLSSFWFIVLISRRG